MRHFLIVIITMIAIVPISFAKRSDPPPLKHPHLSNVSKKDPLLERSWHLERIGAPEAWKKSKGSRDITIAFIDSGIQYNHPEVAANLKWKESEYPANGIDDDKNGYADDAIGWDFMKGVALPFDRSGHGTLLAGIAAGRLDNGMGSAGVCPKCTILSARFLNYEGMGYNEDAIEGIYYAIREKVSAIVLAYAGEGFDEDLKEAIEAAGRADVVVIASAGNDWENVDYSPTYPAKFQMPHQITVAASDQDDDILDTSNWGKRSVHLCAPGDEIIGPGLNDKEWVDDSGTSPAAAVVGGAVGLLRSYAPELSAKQTVELLTRTAKKRPQLKDTSKSDGVLDVHAAMLEIDRRRGR